jgi:aryl-alcohol dehydrogenase-like predicted oxidoreductase
LSKEVQVEKQRLGKSDLMITRVGLGTWAIGGGGYEYGWGPQEDRESTAAIHRALDLGINWIDTAPAYGLGHSEEVVGAAVADRRDEVIIATKCGQVWEKGDKSTHFRLKADSIRREVENSLKRLKVEVIDLYQIHWPHPEEQIEEGWSTIADLIQEGKVRYGGVSNFGVEQLERIGKIHPVTSLQPPYHMLQRDIEEEILPYCEEHDIGVITYSPMMSGLLTGKYDRRRIEELPSDDWRKRSEQFTEPELSANLRLIDELKELARQEGHTLPQLAVAWVLRRPEVTAAIVGARRPSQIEETAPAAEWKLSDELEERTRELLRERELALEKRGIHGS